MCVCGSRGQGWPGWVAAGWAAPPSFNAVRAATRWIRFSVMPSIWGRRVYDAALDGSGLCSEVPYGSSARVISVDRPGHLSRMRSSLRLGIATPALLDAVPKCQYTERLQLSPRRNARPAARSVFVLCPRPNTTRLLLPRKRGTCGATVSC